MGTVSNPATFSSIKAAYGAASNNFSDYVRGGTIVPSNAPTQISTTAAGLAMSQFNGVSSVVPLSATANPTHVSGVSRLFKGTYTIGSSSITAVGGSGTYTYSIAYLSGSISDDSGTSVSASMVANKAVFKETNINDRSASIILNSTWRVTVNDGSTSTTVDVTVTAT